MYHKDSIKQSPGHSKGVSSGWGDDKGLIKEALFQWTLQAGPLIPGEREKVKKYRFV